MTACSTIWDNLLAKTSDFTIDLLSTGSTSHNLFLNLKVLRLIEAENINSIRLSQKNCYRRLLDDRQRHFWSSSVGF